MKTPAKKAIRLGREDHPHEPDLRPYELQIGLILEGIGRLEEVLRRLEKRVAHNEAADKRRDEMSAAEVKAAFEEAKATAAEETDAVAAIAVVIDALVEQLTQPGVTLEDVKALGAQLKSQRDSLAASILKGTPAEPEA